ncbi:hypothetical protein FB451DRAFT_1247814 [Mycena latifolia]|nr:hypothetical protein FB451DRAFT_1247814 [Mycena latifolia]
MLLSSLRLASRCENHYQRPCARHQRIGFHRSATTTKPRMGNEHGQHIPWMVLISFYRFYSSVIPANVPDGHYTDQRHFGFFLGDGIPHRWDWRLMRFRYRRLWGSFCYIASRDPYRFHLSLYVYFLFNMMFSPYSVMKWRLGRSVVAYSWRAGPAFWRIFPTSSFSPSTHSPCPLA